MVVTMCLHQSNMMKTHGGCKVFAFRSIGLKNAWWPLGVSCPPKGTKMLGNHQTFFDLPKGTKTFSGC